MDAPVTALEPVPNSLEQTVWKEVYVEVDDRMSWRACHGGGVIEGLCN